MEEYILKLLKELKEEIRLADQRIKQLELKSNKGVANGYAELDANAKVPVIQIPLSYLDDRYIKPYVKPTAIIDGLVLYFSFNEIGVGTKVYDRSGLGNDGIIFGATWAEGKIDKALSFDGIDDYVIINPVSNFPTEEITATFWMKSSDQTKNGTPLSYATASDSNEFFIYDYKNFTIFKRTYYCITGISANDGQWHHIAVTWKSSDGSTKLYKNGILAYSGAMAAGTLIEQGGSLVLGQEQDIPGGGFDTRQAFLGLIDEVHIYNRVLSSDEIKILYEIG